MGTFVEYCDSDGVVLWTITEVPAPVVAAVAAVPPPVVVDTSTAPLPGEEAERGRTAVAGCGSDAVVIREVSSEADVTVETAAELLFLAAEDEGDEERLIILLRLLFLLP